MAHKWIEGILFIHNMRKSFNELILARNLVAKEIGNTKIENMCEPSKREKIMDMGLEVVVAEKKITNVKNTLVVVWIKTHKWKCTFL